MHNFKVGDILKIKESELGRFRRDARASTFVVVELLPSAVNVKVRVVGGVLDGIYSHVDCDCFEYIDNKALIKSKRYA